ncbi:DotG/IcmE/VirB10 family protein [Pseudoalteromonas sp. OFAV1]|uniref:DotG/IcmE/VirB10 family protein n=1 Tax=Pseudoalteromonas sp. OFAV1 TaxID=2908892 RepID=UPI001F250AE9|nr:DotG/IcmE/VirB10 family protein [Pseudoalteromonas sp. OFAV1]MCF2901201.1 DotG/IcmE/VirB10 family protein [Pseudoalteromonas sp. OFAV1]
MKFKLPKLDTKQKFFVGSLFVVIGSASYFMYSSANSRSQNIDNGVVKIDKKITTEEISNNTSKDSAAQKLLSEIEERERQKKLSDESKDSYIDKPILNVEGVSDIESDTDIKKIDSNKDKVLDIGALVNQITEEKKKEQEKEKKTIIDDVIVEEKVKSKKIELNFNKAEFIRELRASGTIDLTSVNVSNSTPVSAQINNYGSSVTTKVDSSENTYVSNQESSLTPAERASKRRDEELQKYLSDRGMNAGTVASNESDNSVSSVNNVPEYESDETLFVGEMLYAINNLPINSDNSSVVHFVSVAPGGSHGGIFSGSFKKVGDTVALQFHEFNKNGVKVPVNAIAINPDDYSTLFADDVDHHYFQRYGGVVIASLLEGYSESLQEIKQEDTLSGNKVTTAKAERFNDRIMIGIGKAGERLAPEFLKDINKPSTVYVDKDRPVSILFLEDFKVPKF